MSAPVCGNWPKQNSVINNAWQHSIKDKIIHLFEIFSIQVLTFVNSERVKQILSSKNSLFECPGFNLPGEPKKMLIASHQRSNQGHQNLYLKKY